MSLIYVELKELYYKILYIQIFIKLYLPKVVFYETLIYFQSLFSFCYFKYDKQNLLILWVLLCKYELIKIIYYQKKFARFLLKGRLFIKYLRLTWVYCYSEWYLTTEISHAKHQEDLGGKISKFCVTALRIWVV